MSRQLEEKSTLINTIVYDIGRVTAELFTQERVACRYEVSLCHYWCLA
ncbi:MAG: hypothetical protein V3U75_05340 [Methylococcaceae bacterium]